MTAPGRYCLAVCYCGDCDHYKPIPKPRGLSVPDVVTPATKTAWTEREENSSWIDKM